MAFMIPFIQPMATGLATYFGVTGTAATVTTADRRKNIANY